MLENRKIIVGPFSDRSLAHVWSFIYFHSCAEEHVEAHQNTLLEQDSKFIWEAPDLVRSNTQIEHIEDGKFHRVEFVDGTEMIATIWSSQAEYRWSLERGFHWVGRRRGLINTYDDEKATDYAFDHYDKRSENL